MQVCDFLALDAEPAQSVLALTLLAEAEDARRPSHLRAKHRNKCRRTEGLHAPVQQPVLELVLRQPLSVIGAILAARCLCVNVALPVLFEGLPPALHGDVTRNCFATQSSDGISAAHLASDDDGDVAPCWVLDPHEFRESSQLQELMEQEHAATSTAVCNNRWTRMGGQLLQRLAAVPRLTSIVIFDFICDKLTASLTPLSALAGLTQLTLRADAHTQLYGESHRCTEAGASSLMSALTTLQQLQCLAVGCEGAHEPYEACAIATQWAPCVAALTSLTQLRLCDVGLGECTLAALGPTLPALQHLRHLDIS